jgi:hypothetical protein
MKVSVLFVSKIVRLTKSGWGITYVSLFFVIFVQNILCFNKYLAKYTPDVFRSMYKLSHSASVTAVQL